jgi:hypothetical protein
MGVSATRRVVIALLVALGACTTVRVTPVDRAAHPIDRVCIERNPKVVVDGFVTVLQNGFRRNGIETEVYDGAMPAECRYALTYTARRGWDAVPYLKFAELRLTDHATEIGTATYRHAGGFGLNKWASTESKLDPVIDQLLR